MRYTLSELLGLARKYITFILICGIFFFVLQNGCQRSLRFNDNQSAVDLLISTQEDRGKLMQEKINVLSLGIEKLRKEKQDTINYYEKIFSNISSMSPAQQHEYILSIIEK